MCPEAAVRCRRTDRRPRREVRDRQWRLEPFLHPGQNRCQGLTREIGHGTLEELPLPAVAVRRENQSPADGVGDLGTVVEADDVQPEIERGRAARSGEDVTVVHEQHVRFEVDGGEPQAEACAHCQWAVARRPSRTPASAR